jgi:hypothetical protein
VCYSFCCTSSSSSSSFTSPLGAVRLLSPLSTLKRGLYKRRRNDKGQSKPLLVCIVQWCEVKDGGVSLCFEVVPSIPPLARGKTQDTAQNRVPPPPQHFFVAPPHCFRRLAQREQREEERSKFNGARIVLIVSTYSYTGENNHYHTIPQQKCTYITSTLSNVKILGLFFCSAHITYIPPKR